MNLAVNWKSRYLFVYWLMTMAMCARLLRASAFESHIDQNFLRSIFSFFAILYRLSLKKKDILSKLGDMCFPLSEKFFACLIQIECFCTYPLFSPRFQNGTRKVLHHFRNRANISITWNKTSPFFYLAEFVEQKWTKQKPTSNFRKRFDFLENKQYNFLILVTKNSWVLLYCSHLPHPCIKIFLNYASSINQ